MADEALTSGDVPNVADAQEPQAELAYSKEPKLRKGEAAAIRERMKCANRYFECAFKDNAERCRDLYRGCHWPKRGKGQSARSREHAIVVNYLKYVVDTQVAATAHSHPEIILKPQTPLAQANEARSRRALKWGYRTAEAHRETRRALKDSRVYGFGVVQTFWLYEEKETPPVEGRGATEASPEAVLSAVETGEALPAPAPAGPPAPPLKDQPACRRIDPRQFRISPEADWVLENAPWCGYVEVRPLEEVRADPRFRKGITRRLKGSAKSLKAYLSDEYRSESDETKLPIDAKRVELWHYYEKRRQIHVVFAEEDPESLMVRSWDWQHEGYPFDLIFDPLLEDEFYTAVPPLMQWEHMQREINLSRSQIATHRARYNRKYVTTTDALSPDAQKQLESGEDGAVIKVKTQSPVNAIVPLSDAPLQQEVYSSERVAMQDLRTLSTLDQYELGQAPTKRMTQLEVQAVRGAGGALQKAAALEYERFVSCVAEKIFDLMQQYADRTRELPIYDEQEQIVEWMQWDKERIQGDYDFEVYVGSTEIKNQQGRVEEIGFLLQSLTPYVQMGIVNARPLIKQLLDSMTEIRDTAEILPEQPTPGMLPPGLGGEEGLPGGGPPIPPDLLAQLGGLGG